MRSMHGLSKTMPANCSRKIRCHAICRHHAHRIASCLMFYGCCVRCITMREDTWESLDMTARKASRPHSACSSTPVQKRTRPETSRATLRSTRTPRRTCQVYQNSCSGCTFKGLEYLETVVFPSRTTQRIFPRVH